MNRPGRAELTRRGAFGGVRRGVALPSLYSLDRGKGEECGSNEAARMGAGPRPRGWAGGFMPVMCRVPAVRQRALLRSRFPRPVLPRCRVGTARRAAEFSITQIGRAHV